MQSIVDICNTALRYLGDDASISEINPPDGSPQSENCAALYPKARDEVLEQHAWRFANARQALTALSVTVEGWGYAYAAPSDMICPRAIIPGGWQRDDDPVDFTTEIDANGDTLILTDTPSATLRYTRAITNPALFTPLFCEAVSWLLASKLAGPILKGDAGRTATAECYKMFVYSLNRAKEIDANAQHVPAPSKPSWIEARG